MATLYKRPNSPYWWVYYRTNDETIRESTGVRHENRSRPCMSAIEVRRIVEDRVVRAKWSLSPTVLPTSIDKFLDEYVAANLNRNSTLVTKQSCFKNFRAWCADNGIKLLHEVNRAVAMRWVAYRRANGVSDGTIIVQVGLLRAAWKVARASKYVDFIDHEGPWVFSTNYQPAPRIPFTDEEVDKLFSGDAPEWVQRAMRIALSTGGRVGSIKALRWEDIDLDGQVLTFTVCKTSRYSVPIPQELVDYLRPLERPTGLVVKELAELNPSRPSQIFGAYCQKVLGRPANWHHFRHTYITRLQQAGVPERVAKELSNHSSSIIHQAYAHANARDLLPFLKPVSLFPKKPQPVAAA